MVRFIPAGTVVFEIGNVGLEFFVIMEGSCSIYYRVELKDEEKFSRAEAKIKKEQLILLEGKKQRLKSCYEGIPEISRIINTTVELREQSGYVVYHKDKLMNKIVTLTDGKDFGGMSLQKDNKSGRRMATVVSNSDTHCVLLERDSYLVRVPASRFLLGRT